MNTTNISAIATLTFCGWTAVQADGMPAWMAEGFLMEEIVVTAQAPAHLYMEEVVVTAELSDAEVLVAANESSVPDQSPVMGTQLMEEVVVTASMDELRHRVARLRGRRARGPF